MEPINEQERDEMCDIVHVLSSGALEFRDIVGKYVCSSCRYDLERGSDPKNSQPSLALVPHASIRDLFHEVLDMVDASVTKTINFSTVENLYHNICMSKREYVHRNEQSDAPVTSRTLKFHLCPLIQTRGITLRRKAGRGHKLFLSLDEERLNTALVKDLSVFASVQEERDLLHVVASRFRENRSMYANCKWSLADEILAVPSKLWSNMAFKLCSSSRLRRVRADARSLKQSLTEVWPLSNSKTEIPTFSSISSSEFQLAVAVYFEIENATNTLFTGSATAAGPITISLTVSGIATQTTLFGSLLNRLRVSLNPQTAWNMRKTLIADWSKSRDGKLSELPPHRAAVAMIDNINHSQKLAVQTVGTVSTEMNGTATMAAFALPPVRPKGWRPILAIGAPGQGEMVTLATDSAQAPNSQQLDAEQLHMKKEVVPDPEVDTSQMGCDDNSKNIAAQGQNEESSESDFNAHKSTSRSGSSAGMKELALGFDVRGETSCLARSILGDGRRGTERFHTREEFLNEHVPSEDDPDIITLQAAFLGLAWRYSESLSSSDPRTQRSMRALLLSALEGFVDAEPWELRYVDIDPHRHTASKAVVDQKVCLLELLYRPGTSNDNRLSRIGICGDQLTFKMLMESYLASFSERPSEEIDSSKSFAEWATPFVGCFHNEKQSVFSIVKHTFYGSGLEQLLKHSGLSSYHQQNFLRMGNARRNRNCILQIATASAIRACEVLITEDGEAADAVRAALECSEGDSDMHTESYHSYPNSFVRFSKAVTSNDLRVGTVLRSGLVRPSETSPNAFWHLRCILLNSLAVVPWYHALQRSGQTDVVDKPKFWFLPDLMCTNKLNYQELLLLYGFVKSTMPLSSFHTLYTDVPGAAAININTTCSRHSNLWHDECLECTIIRHTKALKTTNFNALSESVAWSRHITKAVRKLTSELCPSRSPEGGRDAEETILFGMRLGYDKDKRTALNVKAMIIDMRKVGHLSLEHLNCAKLHNAFYRR